MKTSSLTITFLSLLADSAEAFQAAVVTSRTKPSEYSRGHGFEPYPAIKTPSPSSRLHMFGSVFGGGKVSLEEPATVYKNDKGNMEMELEALGDYLTTWAGLFTNGSIALTTPVTVKPLTPSATSRGIQLLFRDTKTAYKNSKEDDKEKTTTDKDGKKKKNGQVKQGGVEIIVENTERGITVVAARCEVEEDTIIKEMSEETIMKELKQAIEVWKREKKQ